MKSQPNSLEVRPCPLQRAVPLLAGLLLCLTCLTVASASAQDTGKEARSFLERKQAEVSRLIEKSPAGKPASKKLSQVMASLLDYGHVAQQSLGRHWGKQSPEEQARFTGLLRQLVERSYRKRLRSTLNYQVTYRDTDLKGDTVFLHTSVRSRKNRRQPPIEIGYGLRRSGDSWRVVDVVTDGVSMVRNYRGQFSRIIRKEGWSGLIGRMEKRVKDEGDL